MKCDELKPLVFSLNDLAYVDELAVEKNFENPHDHAVYKATEVDSAIAELKQKLRDAVMWAAKADDENRKLQYALWLARANMAKTEYNHWILIWHCELNNHLFFINKTRYKNGAKVDRLHYPWEWRDIWNDVERKCLKKAEEYK